MRNRYVSWGAVLLVGLALPCSAALAQAPCTEPGGCVQQIKSDNTAYGTTAAEFLLIPAGARGAALGGSFAALVTDVSAVYFNPAGLAQLERQGFYGSSMTYVADTKYSFGAVAFPFSGGSRAIGLSFTSFGFSDAPVYTVEDPNGDLGEVYSVSEAAIGLTYAQQLSDRFSAGFTAKFINDRLGRVTGRAGAVDLGTNFHATIGGRPIRAGFVIQNLGTTLRHTGSALDALVLRQPPQGEQQISQEASIASLKSKDWGLPVLFRVSLSYDVFATAASRLSMMGEFTQPNNTDPGFNVAGEYNLGLGGSGFSVAGRAGFTYAPDNNLDPAAQGSATYAGFDTSVGGAGSDGFSAGGGIRYNRRGRGFGFDYAYRNLGVLGAVNMISVGLSW